MTALRPATITVEFDCDRQCQVEYDLTDAHIRMTLGMMQQRATAAHDAAHKSDPVKTFIHTVGVNHCMVRANLRTEPNGQRCPNCAPGYDCERGIYTPVGAA